MVKKRKTRSQKIASSLRQSEVVQPAPLPTTISLNDIGRPTSDKIVPSSSLLKPHFISDDYQFVKHDLIKTSTITGAIILVELVLFFVVKL